MALAASVRLFLLLQVHISLTDAKWIDMSFDYENDAITWAGLKPYQFNLAHRGSWGKITYIYMNNVEFNEHVGTHMDAPAHFAETGWTVEKIPLENLVGPAIVVNITEKASKDRDAQLTVSDLEEWEKKYGRIPDGSIVLMLSGWDKYWGDFETYMGGMSNSTTSKDYSFPGFHPDAAKWLVDKRKLKGVGVDTRSLDYGKSQTVESHKIFLNNKLFGLESLTNMGKLPPKGATLFVMPMKIKGGSGGPTRVLARIDSDVDVSSGSMNTATILVGVIFVKWFF